LLKKLRRKGMSTTFDNKVSILASIFGEYDEEESLSKVLEYSNMAFPLAYCLEAKIATGIDERGVILLEEAFRLLLEALDYKADPGWDSVNEFLYDADFYSGEADSLELLP
jgi:hypothetical protein